MSDQLTQTAPRQIWLQVDTEDDDRNRSFADCHGEPTWCAESICGAEVRYVRADISDGLLAALERARRCLAWACEQRPEFIAEYEAVDAAIAKARGAS